MSELKSVNDRKGRWGKIASNGVVVDMLKAKRKMRADKVVDAGDDPKFRESQKIGKEIAKMKAYGEYTKERQEEVSKWVNKVLVPHRRY